MKLTRIQSSNKSSDIVFEDDNFVFLSGNDNDYKIEVKNVDGYLPFIVLDFENGEPKDIQILLCDFDSLNEELLLSYTVSEIMAGLDNAVLFAKKISDYLNIPIINL